MGFCVSLMEFLQKIPFLNRQEPGRALQKRPAWTRQSQQNIRATPEKKKENRLRDFPAAVATASP